jgi:hypothetical protein
MLGFVVVVQNKTKKPNFWAFFFFFGPENPMFKNALEIHFKSLHEIKLHLHILNALEFFILIFLNK